MRAQSQFRPISLREIHPLNGTIPNGQCLVVLKSYFDASNKADSTQYDYLCLSSIAGTENLWTPFEKEWTANLWKHCAPFLHTTDALGQHGVYERWKPTEVHDFITDCVTIAKRHIALPITQNSPGRFGLLPYVVSVSLKDLAVANLAPGVARNANEICVRQSFHSCLTWGQEQAACNEYLLYFDRGEPFFGYVEAIWKSKKARQDIPLLKNIIGVTQMNMTNSPALQLADLYGWAVSHFHDTAKAEWHKDILYPYAGEHIDRQVMEQNAIGAGDLAKLEHSYSARDALMLRSVIYIIATITPITADPRP